MITVTKTKLMVRKLLIVLIACQFAACDPSALQGLGGLLGGTEGGNALTNVEIIKGLKGALEQGVVKGVKVVSIKDGYFKNNAIKILFPPKAQKVEKKLRDIGLGNQVDNMIEKINRGAEDAAKGAKPIFVNAIKSMTVNDAMDILMGDNTAATSYLQKTTTSQLYQSFQPVINTSLKKVKALDKWDDVINKYNKIPFVEKMNPDLSEHVTNKAIDGLFHMVGKEEQLIRKDPKARATDILKKVFAKQDK